jgi:hypothetical protein
MRADGSPAFPDPIQLASGESTQCRDEQAWKNLATEVRKKQPQFADVDLKKAAALRIRARDARGHLTIKRRVL